MASQLMVALAVIAAVTLQTCGSDAPVLKSEIDDLLRKLEAVVDKALVQAQAALDEAKLKVNEAATSVQDAAKAEMAGMEQTFQDELDALKLKAKNAGVNIDDCLGEDEQKLVHLPDTYSSSLVSCVSDRITEGINYAQDALNKVQEIVTEVENIKQEIKDCGSGWSSVKCLAKLALKIEEDITSLPLKIEADVAATVVLITQLEEKIKQCASDQTSACESEGESLLAKIAACVATHIIT